MLTDWLARAGFAARARRWFCGADGRVVVEQDARWSDPATAAEQGRARVASRFVIRGEIVAKMTIGSPHIACVNRLNRLLVRALGDRAIVSIQNPIRLADSEPEPDVVPLAPRAD